MQRNLNNMMCKIGLRNHNHCFYLDAIEKIEGCIIAAESALLFNLSLKEI
jgi:hypothetical protein